MSREPERCSHGVVDGARCRPCDEIPGVELVEGGEFVVTVTYSVQLWVPDVEVIASALDVSAADALGELADVHGVAGLALEQLTALPSGSFEVVNTARVNIDVVPMDEQPSDRVLRQLRAKLAELAELAELPQ